MKHYSIIVRIDDGNDQELDDRAVEYANRIGTELGARIVVVNELDLLTGEAHPISAGSPSPA